VTTRRAFLGTLAGGLLTAPLAADAQQPEKVARIGYLVFGPLESPETRYLEAFRQGLRERGYVEGQNIVIEYRSVAPVMGDPIGDGLVASLGRPGGNITGLSFLGPALVPKRLELLKQALPKASHVAVLWHPGSFSERTNQDMLKGTEAAARALGVQLQLVGVRGPQELNSAFSTMTKLRAEALVVFPIPGLISEWRRIVDLATKHRLPSMYTQRDFVEFGGLLAYGASITDLLRRSATHVDKILKGAKPADLPVEQPTKFELVINLKTAKALGLTIPPSLLQRADEVIQ
jgi:putative ABC transport system substrate-binding protein